MERENPAQGFSLFEKRTSSFPKASARTRARVCSNSSACAHFSVQKCRVRFFAFLRFSAGKTAFFGSSFQLHHQIQKQIIFIFRWLFCQNSAHLNWKTKVLHPKYFQLFQLYMRIILQIYQLKTRKKFTLDFMQFEFVFPLFKFFMLARTYHRIKK